MSIRVQNVSKSFGAYQALDRVNIEVPTGALVTVPLPLPSLLTVMSWPKPPEQPWQQSWPR